MLSTPDPGPSHHLQALGSGQDLPCHLGLATHDQGVSVGKHRKEGFHVRTVDIDQACRGREFGPGYGVDGVADDDHRPTRAHCIVHGR